MSPWVAEEMAESQMCDARHAKRLAVLLTRLGAQPVSSIPSACHGWTETVAAYRFLDHPHVGFAEILSGHKQATLERIHAQEVAWLVQDTSFLNYGTLQPKAGMGTVKEKVRDEHLRHTTVAFTPARVNLGVGGAKYWQRPEEPVAHERARKPIAEKESYRWLEGYALACEVQQACPQTVVVSVADCEGDIQEWCLDAMPRLPPNGPNFSSVPSAIGGLPQGLRTTTCGRKCRLPGHWGGSVLSCRVKPPVAHGGLRSV
jgi:hypothetical protein